MNKQTYTYLLPVGLAPSKIEACREELEAALGGTCEFAVKGRIVTITVFKGSLPTDIPFVMPEQNPQGLTVAIGYNMAGELITIDMARDAYCYILGGGYQGTGKSTLCNSILQCIVNYPPEWVRTVLIDLKRGCELKDWDNYPNKWLHAWNPDKPELKHCLTQLKAEIDKRYMLFEKHGVRDINFYRQRVGPMGYIFLMIDEFGELSNTVNGDELQGLLKRTLSIGRAAGLRCCVFLQRPTVTNVIGDIKALFPNRIAFRCATKLESKIILDAPGAEELEEDTPGRLILLHKAKFQKLQAMNYSSPSPCVLPNTDHEDYTEYQCHQ